MESSIQLNPGRLPSKAEKSAFTGHWPWREPIQSRQTMARSKVFSEKRSKCRSGILLGEFKAIVQKVGQSVCPLPLRRQ